MEFIKLELLTFQLMELGIKSMQLAIGVLFLLSLNVSIVVMFFFFRVGCWDPIGLIDTAQSTSSSTYANWTFIHVHYFAL